MPTNVQELTFSWVLVVAGPVAAVSIQAGNTRLYYQLAAALPANTEGGHTLDPRDGVTIELTGTDNLYGRTPSASVPGLIYVTT